MRIEETNLIKPVKKNTVQSSDIKIENNNIRWNPYDIHHIDWEDFRNLFHP